MPFHAQCPKEFTHGLASIATRLRTLDLAGNWSGAACRPAGDGGHRRPAAESHEGGGRPRGAVRRANRNVRRQRHPRLGPRHVPQRGRPDHGPGRRGRRLRHLQRLQLCQQALGHLHRRARAQGAPCGQGGVDRQHAHVDLAEDRRQGPARAGGRPQEGIPRRPVVDGTGPRLGGTGHAAVGHRRDCQRPGSHLGQGDPDRRQGVAAQLRRPAR